MTCAGLLGLAAAHAARNEAILRAGSKPGKHTSGTKGTTARPTDPRRDLAIRAGLIALGRAIGHPTNGRVPPQLLQIDGRNGRAYYFLWSLERVAMIFGLETIGKKDWYSWGAEILLANQQPNGGWANGDHSGGPCCDTAFALLFLSRANLARDLTHSLKGQVQDPVELKGVGVGGDSLTKGPKTALDVPNSVPVQKPSPPVKPTPVERPSPTEQPAPSPSSVRDVAQITTALVQGTGAEQTRALKQLEEGQGSAYTDALAQAISQLEGTPRKEAREALANRLARMTPETLANKLADSDPEVRRAAALASAMREDAPHLAKIIDLLQDPEVSVVRAAHAALKYVSGKDFGPAANASRTERLPGHR